MALRRTDKHGERYYFDTETHKFYISATTFCNKYLPEQKHLTKWKQDLGVFEANRRASQAALYGTMMHLVIEKFLLDRHLTNPQLDQFVGEYTEKNPVSEEVERMWRARIRKDFLSFAKFAEEREIELWDDPEKWCKLDVSEYGGIAGTIDLPVYVKFYGTKKKSIVDLKSGKYFYDSHRLQLALYKFVMDDPELLIFNWAPTDWRLNKGPSFKLENQTGSKMDLKLPHYIGLAKIDEIFTPKDRFLSFDPVEFGKPTTYKVWTLADQMLADEKELMT